MFKVNDKYTKSKFLRRSDAFIVNFEHISHLFLMFLLLTFNKKILTGCANYKTRLKVNINGNETIRVFFFKTGNKSNNPQIWFQETFSEVLLFSLLNNPER